MSGKSGESGQRILELVLPVVGDVLARIADEGAEDVSSSIRICSIQLQAMKRFHHGDSLAVMGAVASAITELEKRGPGTLQGNSGELAVALVRIAYNRMQQQQRRERRLQSQMARGVGREGANLLAFVPADDFSGFPEHLREVVDMGLEDLPEAERGVIASRLEGNTQQQAADKLGLSRAAVQRIEARFRDTVRRISE